MSVCRRGSGSELADVDLRLGVGLVVLEPRDECALVDVQDQEDLFLSRHRLRDLERLGVDVAHDGDRELLQVALDDEVGDLDRSVLEPGRPREGAILVRDDVHVTARGLHAVLAREPVLEDHRALGGQEADGDQAAGLGRRLGGVAVDHLQQAVAAARVLRQDAGSLGRGAAGGQGGEGEGGEGMHALHGKDSWAISINDGTTTRLS